MRVFYWSRIPGKFMTPDGRPFSDLISPDEMPKFHGTIQEWYETLVEVIAQAAGNSGETGWYFPRGTEVSVSPDVSVILQASVLFHPPQEESCVGMVGARAHTGFIIYDDSPKKDLVLVRIGEETVGKVIVTDMYGLN